MEHIAGHTMNQEFETIAAELASRGRVVEATQLKRIVSPKKVVIDASVVEAVRLLESVQAAALQDQSLMNLAARAALLSHQIQGHYSK